MTDTFSMGYTYQGNYLPEWGGASSDKFGYAERKHYGSRDMLKQIEGVDLPFLGRKHFTPTYGAPKNMNTSIKTFPSLINNESVRGELLVKTKKEFNPTIKKYGHREKLHLYQDESDTMAYKSTIKTFYPLEKEHFERTLEKQMGQKRIIDSLEDQRNLIGVKSLGDKKYKFPEYASDFYKEGGLIPGSTITNRTTKKPLGKPIKESEKSRGTKWTDRVKMEEKNEEEEAVKGLFEWEQTSLKEGNPNWRDPDTVEPGEPAKGDPKGVDQKNKKPAAPAKK